MPLRLIGSEMTNRPSKTCPARSSGANVASTASWCSGKSRQLATSSSGRFAFMSYLRFAKLNHQATRNNDAQPQPGGCRDVLPKNNPPTQDADERKNSDIHADQLGKIPFD